MLETDHPLARSHSQQRQHKYITRSSHAFPFSLNGNEEDRTHIRRMPLKQFTIYQKIIFIAYGYSLQYI